MDRLDVALLSFLASNVRREPTSEDDVGRLLRETLNAPSPYKYVVSPDALDTITHRVVFVPESHDGACPITMEDFGEGDIITQLPCGHVFSPDAITNWLLTEKAECPVCRDKLPCVEIRNEDEQTFQETLSQTTERHNDHQNIIALLNSLHSLNNLHSIS